MAESTTFGNPSPSEREAYQQLVSLYRNWTIGDNEILKDLPAFLTRSTLSHILFLDSMYQRILNVSGSIMEFGVRWGRNQSLFTTLRTIYEPYNMSRRIVGFDTFSGFEGVTEKDGNHEGVEAGALSVTDGYEDFLRALMSAQQALGPRSHQPRYDIVVGDATKTLPSYLEDHPETVCALAYFDFDIYEPTQKCLSELMDVMTKGTVIVFDEIGHQAFPGETIAVKEKLGLRNIALQKDPRIPYASFLVVE